MRVRVPASTANLGPGFDALGLALSLYVEVTLTPADELTVTSEGFGAGLFDDDRHLGVRVARDVLGHTNFALHVNSQIPLARGLGSSASLALAAAAAAGSSDPLAVAIARDGHAENAAASFYGGLVVATLAHGDALVEPLPLDASLRFVVVIPDQELATEEAREVLPASVAFTDAVFNLSRVGLVLAGLADATRLRPEAMEDRLHQRYRASLFPHAETILAGLREGGALASCWSGAGSTLLGVATADTATEVAAAATSLISSLSVPGTVLVLEADRDGMTTYAE